MVPVVIKGRPVNPSIHPSFKIPPGIAGALNFTKADVTLTKAGLVMVAAMLPKMAALPVGERSFAVPPGAIQVAPAPIRSASIELLMKGRPVLALNP